VTDPTEYAELRELTESVQIELDAIAGDLFDRIGDLETLRRKLNNIGENLAELLGERVRPAVLEFEEVDR
jgi:hypothetical protein